MVDLVSPHSITLTFKRVEQIVKESEDYETAASILDALATKPFDPVYFNEDQIKTLKNEIELCVLYMYCSVEGGFDEIFDSVRVLLAPIYVKNLWFAGRLLTEDTKKDIGTLVDMPDLFKYKLRELLIRDL